MQNRENNYDLLRIIASFLVVVVHVSAPYIYMNMDAPNSYFTIANFFDSFSQVSLPVFILLSGAFNLSNKKNKDFNRMIGKIKEIVKTLLIWSVFFVVYSVLKEFVFSLLTGNNGYYFQYFKNWWLGRPYYHLWYLYMILGLYLITPFLITFIEEIDNKMILKVSIGFLLFGMINSIYGELFWPIQFVNYLGYYMLGYYIRETSEKRQLNPKFLFLLAILSSLGTFILTEIVVRFNLLDDNLYFYDPLSPFVAMGGIFLFAAFANSKNIKINLNHIVKHTLHIYIIHALIVNLLDTFFEYVLHKYYHPLWYIPLGSIFVYIVSLYLSKIYVNYFLKQQKEIKIKHKE